MAFLNIPYNLLQLLHVLSAPSVHLFRETARTSTDACVESFKPSTPKIKVPSWIFGWGSSKRSFMWCLVAGVLPFLGSVLHIYKVTPGPCKP